MLFPEQRRTLGTGIDQKAREDRNRTQCTLDIQARQPVDGTDAAIRVLRQGNTEQTHRRRDVALYGVVPQETSDTRWQLLRRTRLLW